MKIISKYLVVEFLKSFLISLGGLVFIFIIVDIFEHLSKFIDNQVPIILLIPYYTYQLPWIIGSTLSPIASVLACFLSIGNLSKHFELDAMKFIGVSYFKLCFPLLATGLGLSILILVMNETLAPVGCEMKQKLEKERMTKHKVREKNKGKNIYYTGKDGFFYHLKFIDCNTGTVKGFKIYKFLPDYTLKKRISASKGKWDKGKWVLTGGRVKEFLPNSFRETVFDTLILWLKEKPTDFLTPPKRPITMGFFEYQKYITQLKKRGKDITTHQVDLYFRLTFPFMNLIVILIGFPLAGKVRNIGFIIGFAVALFISFIYWGFMQVVKAFGHVGMISPWVASSIPNLIFILGGSILLWKFRR